MNLGDSCFLCLDIGTQCVRGIAHHVLSGRIVQSAVHTVDSFDTVFALKSVIDELEHQIGSHFESAYITGNFGQSGFEMVAKNTVWRGEHKITASDIRTQIAQITPPDGFFPMHVFPLRYDTPTARNMFSPIGHTDRQLISAFGAIFYAFAATDELNAKLRHAHIQPTAFFDPQFLQNAAFRQKKQTAMFIDFGAEYTSASIWMDRGPVWHTKLAIGATDIITDISKKLNINFDDAHRIYRNVACMLSKEMDRFTPADTEYDFSRADVNDIILPHMVDICAQIKSASAAAMSKYKPSVINISGGGAEIDSMNEFVENVFALPVKNIGADASVRALSSYIWDTESEHRNKYMVRHERINNIGTRVFRIFRRRNTQRKKFIPIMPSTLCFDMKSPMTYSLFNSGDISMIHVDIMDGFYVDRIAGSIAELKYIHAHTNAHLHVHLMTESPTVWAHDAIAAGADTVIMSTNTSGLRAAIRAVRAAGRRAGVALNPESSVAILKPILREVDEVMIMAVTPGAAGQEFNDACLHKISVLAATRKKYGLKYLISVDGGINADTAQKCWAAGADLLVSGSYLAHSNDFPLAVQSLLRKIEN